MAITVNELLASLPEGTRFFRLTNEKERHHRVQYRDGVNQLPPDEEFYPGGNCQPGGLYFFDETQMVRYRCNVSGPQTLWWIREVSFDHPAVRDALIYMEPCGEKYKCNKFYLGERKEFFIDDFVPVTPQNVMRFEGRHIRWTSDLALAALEHTGCAIQNIPEKFRDRKVCSVAVSKCTCAFDYVPDIHMDRDMCVVSARNLWYALEKIPARFIDREICLMALELSGAALYSVPNDLKDFDMCLAAVRKTPSAINYVPKNLKVLVKEKL